jgi:YD repeat-containing protein
VSAASPVTYSYAYDPAGRLSSFTDARGTRTVRFDHDSNRTDYGVGTEPDATHFDYRADDSIASSSSGLTTKNYEYTKPFGGVTDDGCAAYDYDGLDRLTLVDRWHGIDVLNARKRLPLSLLAAFGAEGDSQG